jgi:hypothetical protein
MPGAGSMSKSCQGFGGYHSEIVPGGTHVGYAVLPRCAGIDDLTIGTSHEVFEWATDPFPMSTPAFDRLDDAHWAWQAMMIGELSDMCTFLDYDSIKPAEIGFTVQRHWSNKASLAGQFPCAPSGGKAYYQAIPRIEDEALVPDYFDITGTKQIKTKAIRVAPGKSRTVDVLVYSDQASSKQAVGVRAMTLSELYGQDSQSGFSFTLDKDKATVGSTLQLTIEAPKSSAFDVLVMTAYLDKKTIEYWPVLVTSDDGKDVQAGVSSVRPDQLPGRPAISKGSRIIATRAGLGSR